MTLKLKMGTEHNINILKKKQERRTYYLKNKDKYSCDLCDIKTESQSHLERHKRRKHLVGLKMEDVKIGMRKRYQCTECKYEGNAKYLLENHVKRMHGENKVLCDECDFTTTYLSYLAKHKKTHRSIRRTGQYFCEHCAYETYRKDNLDRHISIQHKGFKYECDNCDYTCTEPRTLKSHKGKKHSVTNEEVNYEKHEESTDSVLKMNAGPNDTNSKIMDRKSVVNVEQESPESSKDEKVGRIDYIVKNKEGVTIMKEEWSRLVKIESLFRQRRQEIYSVSVVIK